MAYVMEWNQRKKLKNMIRRLRGLQMEITNQPIRKRVTTAMLLLEAVYALQRPHHRPRMSPARELLVVKMRNEGARYKNIQTDLKMSCNSITKILKKYGLSVGKGWRRKYPGTPLPAPPK